MQTAADGPGPLSDIRVLEVANWVAAPSCTALLADMGADVVKVEPLGGDGMRGKLRQPSSPPDAAQHDYPFHLDNRGKRSVAVDLAAPAGADVVRELVGKVDVVVTNLLATRLEKYGLAPARLCAEHPRLVYAMVTGYGSDGADAGRVAFDLTAFFGRSGIMSLVGGPDDPPPSFRPGQGDHPTGLALLAGILAALRHRDRTGEGQLVETTLLHTGAWTIGSDVQVALVDGRQPTHRPRDEAMSPLNTHYRCGDGRWITVAAQDQSRWPAVCAALGRPDLAEDERYATPADRFRHRTALIHELDAVFASAPLEKWGAALDEAGVVWAPVAQLPDLVNDEQARAAGLFTEVVDPVAGRFETLAAPFSLSRSEVAVRSAAPAVGQHTDEVLDDWGVPADRVRGLRAAGIISGPPRDGERVRGGDNAQS